MVEENWIVEPDDKARESRLRRRAKRLGLTLRKSRARRLTLDDRGLYRVVKEGWIVAGEKFDLTLDDVEALLDRLEAQESEKA